MFKKLLVIGLVLAFIIAAAGYYYVFVYSVRHHRDVNKEVAMHVSAKELVNSFSTNEQSANQQYLNKVIEVKGAVIQMGHDQSLQKTIMLGSEMELSNVFITLKDTSTPIRIGDSILVKAICTGFLSDVVLVDGVIQH